MFKPHRERVGGLTRAPWRRSAGRMVLEDLLEPTLFDGAQRDLRSFVSEMERARSDMGPERRRRKRALKERFSQVGERREREQLVNDALRQWEARVLARRAGELRGELLRLRRVEALSAEPILQFSASAVRKRRRELLGRVGPARDENLAFEDARADIACDITFQMFLHYRTPLLLRTALRKYWGFLYGVARNKCREYFKRDARQSARVTSLEEDPRGEVRSDRLSPEQRLIAIETSQAEIAEQTRVGLADADLQRLRLALLQRCLPSVKEVFREPLRLRYIEGLSNQQIAVKLARKRETIKTQLNRGRRQLSAIAALEGEEISGDFFSSLTAATPPGGDR